MQNKVIQPANTKLRKDHNNIQKEIGIINPFSSNQGGLSKHNSNELLTQDSQKITSHNKKNPISNLISNKNTIFANSLNQITNNTGFKNKNNKKNCVTTNQPNDTKNNNKNQKDQSQKMKSEKNMCVINNELQKKKNEELEVEEIAKSEKNIIKIKKIKKKALKSIFNESDSNQEIDSIEEEKNKKSRNKNENLKLIDSHKKGTNNINKNNQVDNINYKKLNSDIIKKPREKKDKKENIKSGIKKEINKDKNKQEEILDEILVNENEFDNLKNFQDNNIQKTKFPNLSVNPFVSKPNKIEKNKTENLNNNTNNNKKEEENNINKEKSNINHHIKSSTLGTNNKSSTTYSNSSNLSGTIEFLNSNPNTSSQKDNNKVSYLEIEKNYKNLLLLAKKGDKDKFLESFNQILSFPKNMIDINFKDENGFTALHYSCDEGNIKIVEILLNKKCDPNIKNNEKETPLHLSSKRGFFDISKLLIENGAIINTYNSEKNSPLHYACMKDCVELIQYFLTKDLEVDTKNIYGKTAIDLTTNKEIKELLENYLKTKENENKQINENESSDSKTNKLRAKNPKIKDDNPDAIKNKIFDDRKNIKNININNMNKFQKNKTSISPFSKTHRNKVLKQNIETNQIPESLEINIKKKNTLPRNFQLKPSNSINIDADIDKKIVELNSSNNINKNVNKNNTNSVIKKNELHNIKKEKEKEIEIENRQLNNNPDKININNSMNIYINNNLTNEEKKNKTKSIVKFSSSTVKDKLNNTNLYHSINNGYMNLDNNKINNINIQERINITHKRINLSSNKETKRVNKSFSKIHRETKTLNNLNNVSQKPKSKFCENNSKNKKLLDSIEISNNNIVNLNKTDQNIKSIPKKEKLIIKKCVSNNIKNISNLKLETTEKILTNNKVRMNSKKINKLKKEKNNKDNSLINNCNISKISCKQQKKNILLDPINKSNIIDKTLVDNIHAKLNLNSIEEEKITPSSFVCLAQLGKGSFGEVYLVKKINTNEQYAMKVLRKERIIGQNLLKYAVAERNVLSLSHHPFIVKLYFAFQTSTKLFLILEYCPNGDLAKHLIFEKRFSEQRAKFYTCEVLLALEDLHKRDIIFRDLKPDNVVLDTEGHCKLTDFGLSKEGVNENQYAQSFCGSIAYLAPEMLKKKGHGKAVDWYLLGVLFYEMLVGITPYFTMRKEDIFHNIEYGELNIPDFVSNEAAGLLRGLLERDPNKRLGSGTKDAQEIKEHPYFKDVNWDDIYNKKLKPPIFMNYMNKMIHYYHKERLFANEDLLNITSDIKNPNMLMGWSFINNEDL